MWPQKCQHGLLLTIYEQKNYVHACFYSECIHIPQHRYAYLKWYYKRIEWDTVLLPWWEQVLPSFKWWLFPVWHKTWRGDSTHRPKQYSMNCSNLQLSLMFVEATLNTFIYSQNTVHLVCLSFCNREVMSCFNRIIPNHMMPLLLNMVSILFNNFSGQHGS